MPTVPTGLLALPSPLASHPSDHVAAISRHEVPQDRGDLNQQNLKDRYYGVNDPVARKMLKRMDEMPGLAPPEDKNIRTLYLGNLQSYINQQDIQ